MSTMSMACKMFSVPPRAISRPTSLFILYCLWLTCLSIEALLTIPNNVKLDTEVSFNSPTSVEQLFTVEEYAEKPTGSVQLKVTSKGSEEDDTMKYYRIKEVSIKDEGPRSGFIMSYSIADNICRATHTNAWMLKELSSLVGILLGIEDLDNSSIRKDRTAIGPMALLQIVYANAHLFTLESEVYDEMRFSNVYLFQTKFSLDNDQMIKIITSISKTNVLGKEALVTARTLLSETITSSYPNTITVAVYNKNYERYKPTHEDLYKLVDGESKKLTVSFYLVQELSISRQIGAKPGKSDDQNPFTLPAAAGCGSSSKHNAFYVSAKQFSGLYKARGSANKHYIAFDSQTNSLRFDIFGEYKMIYDTKERLVTYIMPSSLNQMVEAKQDSNPEIDYYDATHCAQTYLDREEDDSFYESNVLEDILGFDTYCGLMYLGSKFLEDGTHCLVFEREVVDRQLPLIVRNNMLKKVKKDEKLYLVYYFVDELALPDDGDGPFNALTYKSLCLRRIELISVDVKYNRRTLNSMITFSEFSWSLDSIAEETRDRRSKIMHPVRTFDTIECKSTYSQNKLEFLVKRTPSNQVIKDVTENKNEHVQKVESFEEGVMVFLSQKMRLPRTSINELELIVPLSGDEESFLVKAKLVDPMSFVYNRELIGWIKSVDSFPFEKYGRFVRTEPSMSRHECSLLLANYLSKRKKIYMTYCPNVGCAYLHDISLEYTKKNGTDVPDYSDSFDMCEIFEQKKVVNHNVVASKITDKAVQKNLNGSKILISIEGRSLSDQQTIEDGIFRGTVVKTLTTTGLSHDSLGQVVKTGVCYSSETYLKTEKPVDVSVTELHLDLHHSLVYCHKACHLYPDCQTYSYMKSSRLCTLTSIHQKLLDEKFARESNLTLVGLNEDASCDIYAINSVRLYSKDSSVLITTPAGFNGRPERHFYYSLNNLDACATMCHLNEFSSTNDLHCQRFEFFPLFSVCAIEDQDLHLYNVRKDIEKGFNDGDDNKNYTELMSRDDWFSSHHCYRYKRDYAQYYVAEEWTSIRLSHLNESGQSIIINLGENREQESDVGSVLYDIDEEDCLRECTMLNSECLAVNYCEHSMKARYVKYCFMFRIRSPFLVRKGEAKLEANCDREKALRATFTKLEAQYFIENDHFSDRYLPIEDRSCTHYYLEGDNLALKRLLLRTEQNDAKDKRNKAVEKLATADLEHSADYLSLATHLATSNIGTLSMILLILAGSTLGLIVSYFGPTLIDRDTVIRASSLAIKKTQSSWSRLTRRKAERSLSTVEFNVELDNIRTGYL